MSANSVCVGLAVIVAVDLAAEPVMQELADRPRRRRARGSAPADRAPALPPAGRCCGGGPLPPPPGAARVRLCRRRRVTGRSRPLRSAASSRSARDRRAPPRRPCRARRRGIGRGAHQRLRLVLDGQDAVADREPVAHPQVLQARARSRRRYGRNGSSRRGSRSRARQSRRSGRRPSRRSRSRPGSRTRRAPRRSRRSRRRRRAARSAPSRSIAAICA